MFDSTGLPVPPYLPKISPLPPTPSQILMFDSTGRRFRYLPKTQADLTRPVSHQWFKTAVYELKATHKSPTHLQNHPLFLTDEFLKFPASFVEDGEIDRLVIAHSETRCEDHCRQIGGQYGNKWQYFCFPINTSSPRKSVGKTQAVWEF